MSVRAISQIEELRDRLAHTQEGRDRRHKIIASGTINRQWICPIAGARKTA